MNKMENISKYLATQKNDISDTGMIAALLKIKTEIVNSPKDSPFFDEPKVGRPSKERLKRRELQKQWEKENPMKIVFESKLNSIT